MKLKTEQNEPLEKPWVISGDSEGYADPALYVAPAVLIM